MLPTITTGVISLVAEIANSLTDLYGYCACVCIPQPPVMFVSVYLYCTEKIHEEPRQFVGDLLPPPINLCTEVFPSPRENCEQKE